MPFGPFGPLPFRGYGQRRPVFAPRSAAAMLGSRAVRMPTGTSPRRRKLKFVRSPGGHARGYRVVNRGIAAPPQNQARSINSIRSIFGRPPLPPVARTRKRKSPSPRSSPSKRQRVR